VTTYTYATFGERDLACQQKKESVGKQQEVGRGSSTWGFPKLNLVCLYQNQQKVGDVKIS